MAVLLIKLGLSLGLSVLSVVVYKAGPDTLQVKRLGFWGNLGLYWGLGRLLPSIGSYGVLGLSAQSDVTAYFWPQALQAAQGGIVYQGFESHYAPLFPYILSVAVLVWRDPRALVLLMVLMEGLALLLTNKALRPKVREPVLLRASLLYLISPAPLLLVVLGGQEDVWLWLFGLIVAWSLVLDKPWRAGVVAALGLAATKVLFGLPLVAFFWGTRRRWRYLISLAGVSAILFLPFWYWAGKQVVLMPLAEGTQVAPPNVWVLINILGQGRLPLGAVWFSGLALGAVAALGSFFFWKHRALLRDSLIGYMTGWVFLFCTFMVLSPKSLGNYVAIFMLPLLCIAIFYNDVRAFGLSLALSALAAFQPSFWFRVGSPLYVDFSFIHNPLALIELAMELSMVILLVLLMWCSWQWASGTTLKTLIRSGN